MVNRVLKEEEGAATYSVWKEEENEEEKNEEEVGRLKTCYIPDVVNDPRIKYFEVPRLGSYLAVPMTYKTCLSENSFDAALDNALECRRLRAEQERERGKLAGELAGEQEDPEQFPEITEGPYTTQDARYVICLDTLGQDSEITTEHQDYCVEWAQFFAAQWERAENECLKHDVCAYIEQHDKDFQKINDKEAEWAEEERVALEDSVKELDASTSEEHKKLHSAKALLEVLRRRTIDPETLEGFYSLKRFKVLKYSALFQLAFYLFGVPKALIVEEGTNKILWKTAKQHINTSFEQYLKYLTPCGPKPKPVPGHSYTLRLQTQLAKLPYDELRNYSLSMGHLYKFLEAALSLRVQDVTNRRNEHLARQEARHNALQAAEELLEKREKALGEALAQHATEMEALEEDDREDFDSEKFLSEFDEQQSNSHIEVPSERAPDEDLDLDWEETHPS